MKAMTVVVVAASLAWAASALAGTTVYVPLGGAGKIVIIDADSDTVVGSIEGTEEAHGLAGVPGGDFLVAGSYAETASAGRALPPKPEGMSEDVHRAHHAAPARQGGTAAAVSFLSLIDSAEAKVTRRIEVPGAVHHTALSPDGRYALATHPNGGGVSVVDLSNATVVKTVATGALPNYAVFGRDGKTAYVSNGGEATVTEIDTEDWVVRRTLAAGETPEHMVLSPDGATLYVANVEAGAVSAISVRSGRIANAYEFGGDLHGLDLSGDGRTLFVSVRGEDKVVAIDLVGGSRRSVALAPSPYHLATVPGTGKIYVSSADEPKIWVLDQDDLGLRGEIAIEGTGHQMVVVRR